jgi:hypothetical protein
MSTLTDNEEKSKIDEGYSRGSGSYDPRSLQDVEQSSNAYTQSGVDQAEAFANDSNNASQSVKEQEEASDIPDGNINYTGNGKQKISGKGWFKKKGPMALIVGLLLGGGAGVTFLLSPGLGIVQFKEILTKDLNDQLAAMDIRQYHVFKAKLKTMKATFGICSGPVNIRCKFSSMSGTQIKKFQKASFEIECEKMPCSTSPFSRNKIKNITFPDDGEKLTDPGKFIDKARSSTVHASALNKAYNPKFAGLADAIATKFFDSRGLSKKPIITENSEEENRKSLKEAVKNGVKETSITAPAGEDEKEKAAREQASSINEEFKENVDKVSQTGTKAVAGGLRGAAKGIGILGAVDTGCSIYRTSVAIESGAKAIRNLQLARYAISFLSVADAIKAGKATPKQVEFVGNIFTSVDTNKELTNPDGTKTPNPFYGKNAFDSPGYKVAAYNEAPKLTARSQQYTIGGTGGLFGTLSDINGAIANLGNSPRETCKVVQNPLTRIGSFIVGIGLGAVTFGGSLAASIGVSSALGVALGIAEDVLTNMLAGTVIDDKTKGIEAGDAMFAGTAALLGGVAQSRGLSPLKKGGVKSYTVAKHESDQRIAAIEKYDAQSTPLDINNEYTFVGSLARNVSSITASSNSLLSTVGSVFTQPLAGMKASALADTYNPERYERCDDTTYKAMDLAPDVFCNLRYGLSDTELAMDTDAVLDYMITNGHISEETGDPKSEDFKNYVTYCTERKEPIGSSGEEGADDTKEGKICFNQDQKYQNFRVYLLDKSISDSMDDEPEGGENQSSIAENSGDINTNGWSFPTTPGATVVSPFGVRIINGVPDDHTGIDLSVGAGAPFYATRDGVITAREYDIRSIGGGAWCHVTPSESFIQKDMWVTHDVDGQKYVSVYAHMSRFLKKTGDTVKAGDLIGYTGGSGCSREPHVHFEIWKGDAYVKGNAIDPAPLIYK